MFEDLLRRFSNEHSFVTKEKLYSMYDTVGNDLKQGKKDNGVWTKALVDAEGDAQKQKAIYVDLMVERIILAEALALEKAKKAEQEELKKKAAADKAKAAADRLMADEEERKKENKIEEWEKAEKLGAIIVYSFYAIVLGLPLLAIIYGIVQYLE